MLAARGTRNLDSGEEPIDDPTAVAGLRGVARKIRGQTVAGAALLTALTLLLPAGD